MVGPRRVGPGPQVPDQAPLPARVFGQVGRRSCAPSSPTFPMKVMVVLTQQSWAGSLGLWWTGPEVPSVGLVSGGIGRAWAQHMGCEAEGEGVGLMALSTRAAGLALALSSPGRGPGHSISGPHGLWALPDAVWGL